MPVEHAERPDLDEKLDEAIFAYLQAVEAGCPPDRDGWLARHPSLTPGLREFFADQDRFERLAEDAVLAAAPTHHQSMGNFAVEFGGVLGDFEVGEEIGSGGMGVVYKARQKSLNRTVALKVLPLAATMDSRKLQRFHNEAQAAANLHHTNIVPVYFVGSERGVHYYAMQFIEGRDLASVLVQLRTKAGRKVPDPHTAETVDAAAGQPTTLPSGDTPPPAGLSAERSTRSSEYFRTVARLGIQAAEALDHAHQLGIVHRDIKPANLLVDAAGRLWVTDFGVAHMQSETRLTMTGDLLGTLRYMSPEQALAKRVVVDHRTDVYSLGATLYELLTLRPVFAGDDRQELLRQIALEEPTPPRRINKATPPELEIIVLKAMEKNPADRYATAGELVDDLRRYLEDKPIQARRPTLPQRAAKWARRHPAIVWAAVIVLAVTVPVLAASTAWALHMNAQTAAANQQADERRREADDNAQKARDEKAEAQKESRRADNNFRQAIEEISKLVKAAEDTPELEQVRKAQSDRALAFYQRLLQENRTDPAGRLQTGLVYRQLVHFYGLRGDTAKAVEAYRQAIALFKQLSVEFPDEASYKQQCRECYFDLRWTVSDYHNNRAIRAIFSGRYQEAARFLQQAETLSETLVTETVDDSSASNDWYNYGLVSSTLAYELWAAGQSKEAEAHFSKALAAHEKAAELYDVKVAWLARMEQARVYSYRGALRAESERLPAAEADYQAAAALLTKLAPPNHMGPTRVLFLARVVESQGKLLWATNRRQEATQAFQQAADLRRQIVNSNARGFTLLNEMAWFHATCPDKQFRNQAEAVELAKQAVEAIGKLASHDPRKEGECWRTLGVASYRAGDWKAAVEALEKAMQFRNGGDGTDWFFLAMAHWQLGDKDKARTWYDKGVEWMDQNKPKDAELRRFRAEAAEMLGVKEK